MAHYSTGEDLLTYQDSIHRLQDLVAVDPEAMSDPRRLIDGLGGVSLAVSSIAFNRGTHVEGDASMWTTVLDKYSFTVMGAGLMPASIWEIDKSSGRGYRDNVIIPSDEHLEDLATLVESEWPESEIYAGHIRGADGVRAHYWPFHRAAPNDMPITVALPESPALYFGVLRRLSRKLLELAEPRSDI